MKFSIVVPTYNRAHIICKTLDSILAQTYSNFEVLIVDNCSTDNTAEKIKKYLLDERFKFIVHDKNYERSKSRNTGMNNASGDYLTFLDSDDIMLPNCLHDAFVCINENNNFPIFHNKFSFADTSGNLLNRYQQKVNYNRAFLSILEGNFLACIGVFINKNLYQQFKFTEDSKLIGVEDWLFWVKILNKTNKISLINKANSLIIEHNERTVNNTDAQLFDEKIKLFKNTIFNDLNLNSKEIQLLNYSTLFIVAVSFCDARQKGKAFKSYLKIIKLNPLNIFKPKIINLLKNILFR